MIEKKRKTPKPEPQTENNQNVENKAPERVWKSWDEWFGQYALKNGVDVKWKKSIKLHTEAIDCMDDPAKWVDGIKNFGL